MKKRSFGIALGVILILIGCQLLTEGGFRISLLSRDALSQSVPEDMVGAVARTTVFSEKKDVAISACVENDTVCILEFSRNPVLNRYSLTDSYRCGLSEETIHSVVSTAFYHYPYAVDLSDFSIDIFAGTHSDTPVYSAGILLLGCVILACCLWKKEPFQEKQNRI